jgi:hypothetical protein
MTALSPARASREFLKTVVRSKAAWRLRFPPQSMTFRAISKRPASPFAAWGARAFGRAGNLIDLPAMGAYCSK